MLCSRLANCHLQHPSILKCEGTGGHPHLWFARQERLGPSPYSRGLRRAAIPCPGVCLASTKPQIEAHLSTAKIGSLINEILTIDF